MSLFTVKRLSGDTPASPATGSPATETAPTPVKRGLFSKQKVVKPASEDVTPADSVTGTTSKGFAGLFGRKSTKSKKSTSDDSESQSPAVPKAKKGASSGGLGLWGSAPSAIIMAELDTGKKLYWKLTSDDLAPISDPVKETVICFSNMDHRAKVEGSIVSKKAASIALHDLGGEQARLINLAKDGLNLYFTTAQRVSNEKNRLMPGVIILDRLRLSTSQSDSTVCGFHLKGSSGSLLVLFLLDIDGEITKSQISVNPDDTGFIIQQFALLKSGQPPNLFSNSDFLAKATPVSLYPLEPYVYGIPVSRLTYLATVATMVVGGGLAAYATTLYTQAALAKGNARDLVEQAESIEKANARLIESSVLSVTSKISLDLPTILDRAESLWYPGIKLSLTSDYSAAKYMIWSPLQDLRTFQSRPTAFGTDYANSVAYVLNVPTPDGCSKDLITMAGTLNEIQTTISCPNRPSPLANYRSR